MDLHLTCFIIQMQEDELLKIIASSKVEADVVNTWINFLEDAWVLQCSDAEVKEKQAE